MSRSLNAQDQAILRRVAASLPAGAPGRAVLAGLSKISGGMSALQFLEAHERFIDRIGPKPAGASADLVGARLPHAYLPEANLVDANLRGANLRGADLRRARMNGVDLTGADLTGADLSDAVLEGARLDGAKLDKANLSGADIEGASFKGTSFSVTNLSHTFADLANFSGSDLSKTDLRGANLMGAILDGVILPKGHPGGWNSRGASSDVGPKLSTDVAKYDMAEALSKWGADVVAVYLKLPVDMEIGRLARKIRTVQKALGTISPAQAYERNDNLLLKAIRSAGLDLSR